MAGTAIHVTNHAVLRYIERIEGHDLPSLRRQAGKGVGRLTDREFLYWLDGQGFDVEATRATIGAHVEPYLHCKPASLIIGAARYAILNSRVVTVTLAYVGRSKKPRGQRLPARRWA